VVTVLWLCFPADAIGTKRFDAQTGADREVQRILLELLNQMDGFDQQTNVKVGTLLPKRRNLRGTASHRPLYSHVHVFVRLCR
jgi:hypothetical protein